MSICLLIVAAPLFAQFYFNETCRNATGIFAPGGSAPGYTANGLGDPVGNGWLRLTNLNTGQAGFVKFTETFPSTMGCTIEFDFKVYGTQPSGWYDGLADGFSVFLFDGAYVNSFQIGESGGSLGYKNMPHRYVGIGLDEYGNFNGGRNKISVLNANDVAVGATPIYLGLSAAQQDGHLEYMTLQNNRPTDAQYYRRIKIDILPNGTGGMKVDVYLRKVLNGPYITLLSNVQLTTPVPALFGMGFGASTGSGVAFHEVRDLVSRTPGDLYVYMPVMPCLSISPNDTTTITTHVVNGLGASDSIRVCDTLPASFTLIAPPSASFANSSGTVSISNFTETTLPDGRHLYCYQLSMNSYGEVIMTYIGHFASGPTSFTIGSSLTPPSGDFGDMDSTDNHFTVTVPLVTLDTVTICYGDSYIFGNNTLTASGDYVAVYPDAAGCDSIIYLNLTVSEAAYFELGEDITICNGDITYLQTDYNYPNTFYYWNTGANTPKIRVVAEGEYTLTILTWIKDSTILCRYDDTVRVISTPYPIADFNAYPTEGCTPFTVKIQNETDLDNHVHPYDDITITYSWEVYDAEGRLHFVSSEVDPEFEFTQQSNYHVQLIATTNMGCSDTIIKTDFIRTVLQPHAEFMAIPETQFLSDSGIHFLNYTDTSILATSIWYWDFGDGTTDSSTISPTHQYEEWGDYVVTLFVRNGLGCSDEISHRVSIEAELQFPNVITPNGDGLNDVFAIENLNTSINSDDPAKFRTNRLSIFNRWGRKVYDAENYDTFVQNGDITIGKKAFDGRNCPDGTYYYTFYYRGKMKTINVNGTLMILGNVK